MKDKARSTKVKGTVLFTVISVLMILIVFLMGTLALAATASNRAYTNYQREQTEYTARAVLDSVVKAINEDTSNNGIKSQMVRLQNTGNSFTVSVRGSDGVDEDVTITNTGQRSIYSPSKEEWVTGTIYELSTTVDKTLAGTTYSAYIVDEKVVGGGGGGGAGGAFVSLGGVGGKIGTGGFTAGGTEIGIGTTGTETYEFDNGAVQMVPFYIHGNLDIRSQCSAYFNKVGPQQFMAITGDLTLHNNFKVELDPDFEWPTTDVDYTEVPCIFVGGTLKQETSDNLFNADPSLHSEMPMNVYCGNIVSGTVNKLSFNGDLYAFDENETNVMKNDNGSTLLYQWTERAILNAPEPNFGNFFSKGSAEIKNVNIDGVVRVEKDLTIFGMNDKTYTLNNDVVSAGTLKVDGAGTNRFVLHVKGNIYADTLLLDNCTVLCDGIIDVNTIEALGTAKIQCDTIKCQTYNTGIDYNKRDDSDYVSGTELNKPNATTETVVAKKAGLDAEGIYPKAYTKNEIQKTIVTVPTITQYMAYPTTLEMLDSTIKVLDAGNNLALKNYNDKASFPDVNGKAYGSKENPITTSCVLTGNRSNDVNNGGGDLYIEANSPIAIVVDNFSAASSVNIIIDDNARVYFFIRNSMTMEGGDIITEDYQDYLRPGGPGRPGPGGKQIITEVQPDENSPYYPNVYMFAAQNATFESKNNRVVTAHVRAPLLSYKQDNGRSLPFDVEYQQVAAGGTTIDRTFHQNEHVGVIGQLICNNITVTNGWGMIYVRLDDSSSSCSCCSLCTGTASCQCVANGCTCASCICSGGGGGGLRIPDRFETLYYNYY